MNKSLINLIGFAKEESPKLTIVGMLIIFNTAVQIITPFAIIVIIDQYIIPKRFDQVMPIAIGLIILYVVNFFTVHLQTKITGRVTQRILYKLRQKLFSTLQQLPVSFFGTQKSGDLTSRLNNDTDKINSLLSETIVRFVGLFFQAVGVGIFVFFVNWQMALIMWSSVLGLIFFNSILSDYSYLANKLSSRQNGELLAQLQDDMNNYKAIFAFDRQDFMIENLQKLNSKNYKRGIQAGFGNSMYSPCYNFVYNISLAISLIGGLWLISEKTITIGLLVGFVNYSRKFYEPLKILGTLWGGLQSGLASWNKVQEILVLDQPKTSNSEPKKVFYNPIIS